MRGHVEVAQLLLDAGARKEVRDFQGQRPLHVAAKYGHTEVMDLLRDRGAEAKDRCGHSPSTLVLALLQKGRSSEVEEEMRDVGMGR